jgi:hypothetical protein
MHLILDVNKSYKLIKDSIAYYVNTFEKFDNAGNKGYILELWFRSHGFFSFGKYYYFVNLKKKYGVESLSINSGSESQLSTLFNQVDTFLIDITFSVKGKGLGSLVLNNLILWAQLNYPNFKFKDIQTSEVDEFENENKIRRDRLYANLGYQKCANLKDLWCGMKAIEMKPKNSNFGFSIYEISKDECKKEVSN